MPDQQYEVVVIGAGPGGYGAAFHAADLGLRTALIDYDPNPGGVCLLRGCIPSKALLHAAKILTDSAEAGIWGIHFEKPRIDLEALRKQKTAVVDKLVGGIRTLAKSRKVDYINARATLEGPN